MRRLAMLGCALLWSCEAAPPSSPGRDATGGASTVDADRTSDGTPSGGRDASRDASGGAAGGADARTDDASVASDAATDATTADATAADAATSDAAVSDAQAVDATPSPPNPEDARINEVDCAGREWIELVNLTDAPVDLSGWRLAERQDPDEADTSYELPAGTQLEPGAFLVVEEGSEAEARVGFGFGIACGDDEVRLIRPDGSVADSTEVPSRGDLPVTWGRFPDGRGDWTPTESTEGARNRPGVDPGPILFDPIVGGVPTITLTVTPEDATALTRDARATVQAELQFQAPGQPPMEPIFVGLHLKGRIGSFRPLSGKSGFKVDVNWVDSTQRLFGMKELTLNNLVQDRSTMSQWMAYEIFRAAGVCAPRVGFARVIFNGTDYGLYGDIENYDDLKFGRCFESTGHVYEGRYGEDLRVDLINRLDMKEGDPLDRSDMEAIVAGLDAPPPGGLYATRLGQSLFDWDPLLTTMATEIFVGHWDGYSPTRNNWLMHVDGDGRLSLQPWGTDQCFDRNLDLYSGQGRIFQYCMTDAPCRAAYETRMGRVLEALDALDLEARAREVFEVIAPEVDTDTRDSTNLTAVRRSFEAHLSFISARRQAIGRQLECVLGANADPDGDGFRCETDCAPNDPTINPGAADACRDGIDQDCSGVADDNAGCPDCETFTRDGHNYLVCTTPRNWQVAGAHCAAFGAVLAAPDSAAEATWLMSKARTVVNQDYWTGLNDRDEEGNFTFLNTRGATSAQVPWSAGEPNNAGDEDCAFLRADDATFNDLNCLRQKGVLCEEPCAFSGDADRDGHNRCGSDCDDQDNTRYPGAPEVCGDGVDQDCDERVDEGENCDCREVFRGAHRYRVCGTPRTQGDARAVCRAQGADLAVYTTAGEAVWVATQLAATQVDDTWVGLGDPFASDEWTWVGGDPLDLASWGVPAWAPGQPDSGGADDCVAAVAPSGRLDDRACDQPLSVVCEDTCVRRVDLDFDSYTACGTDCDDSDAATHPGAREVCGDRRDQDCDGVADEGCR